MLKGFYVSGFLYHEPTNQILLQQESQSPTSMWSLFESDECANDMNPSVAFARVIQESLQLTLVIKKIQEVYTYLNEDVNKNYSISYAQVKSLKTALSQNGKIFQWFSPREIQKVHLSPQARHDVTVGQRVIDAKFRKKTGQHTFE